MKKTLILVIIGSFLWGCVGSPKWIGKAKQEELVNIPTAQLINAYNFMSAPHMFAQYTKRDRSADLTKELKRRRLVPDSEWELIEQSRISMGMSEMGLYLSWGFPYRINKSVGSYGVHKQCVYRMGKYNTKYVYIEDGKITGWQD